jgi:protein-S-isoprenylcysteine O-methyltransferase Ste14
MGFLALLYGAAVFVFFLATFFYTIGFIANVPLLPKTIDSGAAVPLAEALVVNLLLLAVFAVQHSVMARRGFKRWWTRIVPEAVERSTYVLAATLALLLILVQWRPIAEPVIWHIDHAVGHAALYAVSALGWAVLLISTFLINHFELFGLRQVFARLLRRDIAPQEFRTPGLYRHVRHPIYLGFILGIWGTPHMSAGHLLFAIGTAGYILVGIWFEERDLIAQFGDRYRVYREQVGMLIPRGRKHRPGPAGQ